MRDISCVRGRCARARATFSIFLALMVAGMTSAGVVIGAAAGETPAPPAAASARSSARKPVRAARTPAAVAPAAHAPSAPPRAAATPTAVTRATATPPVATARGRAGMVVGIDPASGELGPPTAEQIQAIQAELDPSLDRSTAGLEVIAFADGSRRVNLEGRFRSYSVVTIGADGEVHMECVEGRASALALARAGASSIVPGPAHAARAVVGPREE